MFYKEFTIQTFKNISEVYVIMLLQIINNKIKPSVSTSVYNIVACCMLSGIKQEF
jgi:hypothetical protein